MATVQLPRAPGGGALVARVFRHDVPASLVVFLVAIPLSLGIAGASGAPLVAGLIAAAAGGIIAGLLGGAPLQVSGPAAGLTLLVAGFITELGWPAMAAITVGAGLLQVVFGLTRVGRLALSLSPAVVHGMLAGIGITIAIGQLRVVLGGKAASSVPANLAALPGELFAVPKAPALIGVLTVILLVAVPRLAKLRAVPAPLVAVAVATAAATGLDLELVRVELPDDPLAGVGLPRVGGASAGRLMLAAATLAVVASVESLLSAVAIDRLHEGRRADLDRELVAQGAANVASGFLGGLPVTGVIVRGSTNVAAGARTRASGVLHGVWVVVALGAAAAVLELIPLSALAAVLVVVGVRLVSAREIRALWQHRELPAYLATAGGVVLFGLLEGVAIGLAVALGIALWRLTHCSVDVARESDRWRVTVRGALVFVSSAKVLRALRAIPPGEPVLLDLHVDLLDHAGFDVLDSWRRGHERLGGTVEVDEVYDPWLERAASLGAAGRRTLPAPPVRWYAPWTHWQPPAMAGAGDPDRAVSDGPGPDGAGPHANGDRRGGGIDLPHRRVGTDDGSPAPASSAAPAAPAGSNGDAGVNRSGNGNGVVGTSVDRALVRGIHAFERSSAPLVRPFLAELVDRGQQPGQLFITCADSRVMPNLITTSGPGDLFTVRNIGNLVPPPGGADDASVGAAVEYAVDLLHVPSIVVCGHSDCGAMKALLQPRPAPGTSLGDWLRHGEPALAGAGPAAGLPADRPPCDHLAVANVVRQLDHLRAYPCVAHAVAEGRLELVGLWFDLSAARTYLVRPDGSAEPVTVTDPDPDPDLVPT